MLTKIANLKQHQKLNSILLYAQLYFREREGGCSLSVSCVIPIRVKNQDIEASKGLQPQNILESIGALVPLFGF